jgi:hypothetical protein
LVTTMACRSSHLQSLQEQRLDSQVFFVNNLIQCCSPQDIILVARCVEEGPEKGLGLVSKLFGLGRFLTNVKFHYL